MNVQKSLDTLILSLEDLKVDINLLREENVLLRKYLRDRNEKLKMLGKAIKRIQNAKRNFK